MNILEVLLQQLHVLLAHDYKNNKYNQKYTSNKRKFFEKTKITFSAFSLSDYTWINKLWSPPNEPTAKFL